MRKVLQCCFSWLLLGVAGGSVAATAEVVTLAEGTHTLASDSIYRMSAAAAEDVGVTKAWTLSASKSTINVALQVNLGSNNNTVILNLTGYSPQTDGLQDAAGNDVPALKVVGKGTLIIRHSGTTPVYLRIKDKMYGEQPAIDLSGMTGGEVRFERAAGATGRIELWRVWVDSTVDPLFSVGQAATPVIVGNAKVRIIFAPDVRVRFFNCVYVKSTGSVRELPAMISEGYEALRIEEGAEVNLYKYRASSKIVTTAQQDKWSWVTHDLFPAAITLAGGSLELDEATGPALIEIPSTSITNAIALVRGQGEAFGKKIFTVSTQSRVVPESCIKVADGSMLTEEERKPDENGRLVIAAAKSPELVYAQTSESDQNAVTVFGLTPEITETGCTIKCNFGIADLKVDQVDSSGFVSTLKVSVDLPDKTVSTRAFYLRVLQTSPNGTETTIYPTSGTAALTTFTRDAPGSSRFSASIPCRITPSRGTTSITVRAYATPPAE